MRTVIFAAFFVYALVYGPVCAVAGSSTGRVVNSFTYVIGQPMDVLSTFITAIIITLQAVFVIFGCIVALVLACVVIITIIALVSPAIAVWGNYIKKRAKLVNQDSGGLE